MSTSRHRPWWAHTTEAIYAYRTRKPHAVLGLPLFGRHWAYVGRTNDLARRDAEHLIGGGQYRATPKLWADLEPQRYVIFRRKRRRELTTHLLEWSTIRVLMPVYNVSMNGWNPRRIKRTEQVRQRLARNQGSLAGVWRRVPVYTLAGLTLIVAASRTL